MSTQTQLEWEDAPFRSDLYIRHSVLPNSIWLAVSDHTGEWKFWLNGSKQAAGFATREAAKAAAIKALTCLGTELLLAVGWPDDATISKTLAVWYQDDNWQQTLSPYVNKTMDEMRAAVTAGLKEAAGE